MSDDLLKILESDVESSPVVNQQMQNLGIQPQAQPQPQAEAQPSKGLARKTGKGLKKVFVRVPQEFYGLTDDFGKLTALQVEMKSYQKALNLTDDEAFDYAAEIVRNTMPTYGVAPPISREFARTPLIGNYILFPTELIRTTKNILKQSDEDMKLIDSQIQKEGPTEDEEMGEDY